MIKGQEINQAGVPESFRVLMKEFQALGLDISIINDNNEVVGLKEMEEEEDREELEGMNVPNDIPLPPPSDPNDDYEEELDEDDDELSDEDIDREFNSVYENEFMEGEDD